MSLKVWLPFINDLKNIGNSEISYITSPSSSFNNKGKIGDCLKVVSQTELKYIPDFNNKSLSFGGWFKFNKNEISSIIQNLSYSSTASTPTGNLLGNTSYGGIGLVWTGNNYYSSNTFSSLYIFATLRTSSVNNSTSSISVDFDTWIHIMCTWDVQKHILSLYKNGVLINSKNFNVFSDGVSRELFLNYNAVYGGNGPRTSIPFYCNDIRIYDHCLSPLEIKQISQGLILHYKLNNNFNLIKNGYGESGSENWGTVANVSSDIPTGNSCIKQSFYNNTTQEYIPLISSHEYKFEVYIKNTSTSGSTYPSFYPYDIDKNFINVFNCPEGFNLSTMTTLTKELKSGDTKIEVADLSKWNANSGHYYNYAALFGYRDSTGFLYPNGTYTRNTPAFGSSTNAKTNLDKTNNIITLNSSYNGPTMAVGTSVCASTAGSTYYYPFGSIAKSSINDWTYKTVNFIPQNVPRLRYAKYIKYSTYDGTLHAGIKLIDLFYDLNKIQDSSGYNHNGQLYSYDTQGGFISVSNTPRYDTSVYIDSANNTTNTASGTTYIYGHCSLTNPTQMTVAFWCKPIAGYGGGTTQGQFCTTNIAFGNNNAGSDYQASAMNHRDGAVDVNDSVSSTQCRPTINFIANEWHHYVFTYNGKDAKSYRDGILQDTKSFSESKTLDSFIGVIIGFSKAGGVWRSNKSYYSDFRVYCTALDQNDIKKLYNVNMSVDNLNQIHIFELNEIEENLFRSELITPLAKSGYTTRIGEIVEHNGDYAMNIAPAPFYKNISDDTSGFLQGCFLSNTSYTFDMWIDVDSVIYNGNNVSGGLSIVYSDGTSDSTFVLVGGNKGYQHRKLITPANKSIDRVSVYYYISTDVFYRLDSYICKTDDISKIIKKGLIKNSNFIQTKQKNSISKGGIFYSKNYIEK